MSMSDWDLIEQVLMIVVGAGYLWFLLSSRGKD